MIFQALIDAGLTYDHVETAAVGYCYGDSTCGQRVLYQLGLTQIPVRRYLSFYGYGE